MSYAFAISRQYKTNETYERIYFSLSARIASKSRDINHASSFFLALILLPIKLAAKSFLMIKPFRFWLARASERRESDWLKQDTFSLPCILIKRRRPFLQHFILPHLLTREWCGTLPNLGLSVGRSIVSRWVTHFTRLFRLSHFPEISFLASKKRCLF